MASGAEERPWRIERVSGAMLVPAAQRLVEASAKGVHDAAGRFLKAAKANNIDLSLMWASLGDPGGATVRQVCLVVPGAGKTATFFTSRPDDPAGQAELGRVIERACRESGDRARVGQTLLETKDLGLVGAFEAGGFERIGRLLFLVRPRPGRGEFGGGEASWPEGVSVRAWGVGDEPAAVEALGRSYEATLDCPELSRLRRPEEVLESHRSVGSWDPSLWWLVWNGGRPEGAMLLSPTPSSGTVELVYLGLSPGLRGRGLGRRLLGMGLSRLSGRSEKTVTCAVDERNEPARRLYEGFGFVRFDERTALVRALGRG